MGKLLGNKIFLIGGSLVVLLALGVVLGLTIVRIQNQQATINLPRAASNDWPSCTKDSANEYKWEGSLDGLNCCNNIAGSGFDACGWPARGWCTAAQCDAGNWDYGKADCSGVCPGSGCVGRCRCGLYWFREPGCHPVCTVGKAVNPVQTNGQINVSTTPTLEWNYSPDPSGGKPYASVYLWSCSARNDDCMVFASANATATSVGDSVAITSFYKPTNKGASFQADWQTNPNYYVKSLKQNTQYWWAVTPGVSGCGVQTNSDTWTFTTGTSGGVSCSSGLTACSSICVNLQTNASNCGACGNACDTGQSCSAGACITGTPGGQFACDGLTVSPSSGATPLAVSATVGGHDATGRGDVSKFLVNFGDNTGDLPTGGSDANVISHTYSQAGTFTAKGWILDRDGAKSADAAECQKTVTVTGTTTCTADAQCPSGQRCVSGVCTTTTSEVNACWGNGGNNGRCYDCNGDGEVNILDFACFRAKYQQNVL